MKLTIQDGQIFDDSAPVKTEVIKEFDSKGDSMEVPSLLANICKDICSKDWKSGYEGANTRIAVYKNAPEEPPEGRCWVVLEQSGAVFMLPHLKTNDWLWWAKNIPRTLMFINGIRTSNKHNFIHRTISFIKRY